MFTDDATGVLIYMMDNPVCHEYLFASPTDSSNLAYFGQPVGIQSFFSTVQLSVQSIWPTLSILYFQPDGYTWIRE